MHLGSVPFSTPFSNNVMNALRPRKVKILILEVYAGTTNPEEHLVA